ncbi:MAG TPA: ATP-binding protein [Solirubrobacteraceae bacterium]
MARFTLERARDINGMEADVASAPREQHAEIELVLRAPADAASLAVVRHSVGATAAALGFDAARVADVRLALTEAMTAAIRRAVAGEMLEVRAVVAGGALRVAVRDKGGSMRINDDLPLPLVAALSDAVEVSHLDGGGTEVAVSFGLSR